MVAKTVYVDLGFRSSAWNYGGVHGADAMYCSVMTKDVAFGGHVRKLLTMSVALVMRNLILCAS